MVLVGLEEALLLNPSGALNSRLPVVFKNIRGSWMYWLSLYQMEPGHQQSFLQGSKMTGPKDHQGPSRTQG